ncbi:hypothetical protein SAMN05443244_2861 [Terriglobus roseus]|uniref:Uncharacterized protein n=1 Tax=Terriglobus roseus TaxID=392734 RepID=A0A1H4QFX6_9BACT|nr:hypothetical protein SAMN05443244_2861 [Terriglobus roseus]
MMPVLGSILIGNPLRFRAVYVGDTLQPAPPKPVLQRRKSTNRMLPT